MGKRFRFRLDKVLELRRFEEKQALMDLAETMDSLGKVEAMLERLRAQRLGVSRETALVVQGGGGSLSSLPGLRMSLTQIEELIDLGIKAKARQEQILDLRRTQVAERRGTRKAMEELEERSRQRFFEEMRRIEAQELDEVGARRHGVRSP